MARARRHPPAAPPGYPSDFELSVRLKDGRQVDIRPILPTDAPELGEAIKSADAQTLRARFLGGPPPITDAVLRGLVCVDYVSRFALVARHRGRGVAIARYEASPGSVSAELAVVVSPAWRRVGLATALVELLGRRAQECGITDFTAFFMADNRPVTELAHSGNARVVIADGIAQLSARLTAPHTEPE